MKKMYVTVGISSSGKTTWANEQCNKYGINGRWFNINRDYIRLNILNNDITWKEYKFNKTNEAKVTETALELFDDAVDMGIQNIIISDTNLNEQYRNEWIKRANDVGYEVEIVEFPITYEEACKRNELRHNGIPRNSLYRQYQQWNEYIGRKTYVADESKPKAIIVDIDGTVAERFDRSPFDWKKVGQDKPRTFIIDLIKCYANTNPECEIIFVSGRDEICRQETLTWIEEQFQWSFLNNDLFMRKENDMRKDTFVKEEIFWEHIADNYNVIAVFDDRKCVVDMWHELKIPNVIAVADQNIEF